MLRKIQTYIFSNKIEVLLLCLIILVSAFFRLYKIADYMTFLGDEGRDVMVVKGILQGDFTLLGPRASAGDFFLGPVYYYMMAPFLYLSNLDPVGPAVMVALFGIATVFLVYIVGKSFFGRKAAFIASGLYAISPLVVGYSRSSWNPNLMPFFSLLLLFLTLKAVKNQSHKLFILVGFLIGIALQLHYLTVFLGVIVFIFTAVSEVFITKKKLLNRYLTHGVGMLAGFMVGLSPFLLFEIRHGFPNIVTIVRFIFADNTTKVYSPGQSFLGNIWDVFFRLFGRLITKFPPPEQVNLTENIDLRLWQIATVVIAVFSISVLYRNRDKFKMLLISLWLYFGILLFGIYKQPIYDYYLGFMFPLPFLLVGNFLSQTSSIKKYRKLGSLVAILVLASLVVVNLYGAPFRYPGNKQKDQAKKIADTVLSKTGGKPYNFALITRGNSDHVYRYFLEAASRAPVTILNEAVDPKRESVTSQLLVVCEYPECQPLGNSLWEVAGFGRAEITGSWQVPFVTIYRLVHYARPEGYDISKLTLALSYENKDLGFSFQYPESFSFKNQTNQSENFDDADEMLFLSTPEANSLEKVDYQNYLYNSMKMTVKVFRNSKNLNLDDFMKERYSGASINPGKTVIEELRLNLKESNLPKEEALVYEGRGGGEDTRKYYLFINQDHFYEITLRSAGETGSVYSSGAEKLFDEIVTSFKFK